MHCAILPLLPHHSRSAAPLRWLKQGEVRPEVALLCPEVPQRTPEPLLAQLAAPHRPRLAQPACQLPAAAPLPAPPRRRPAPHPQPPVIRQPEARFLGRAAGRKQEQDSQGKAQRGQPGPTSRERSAAGHKEQRLLRGCAGRTSAIER
jgi:hypothetical protein